VTRVAYGRTFCNVDRPRFSLTLALACMCLLGSCGTAAWRPQPSRQQTRKAVESQSAGASRPSLSAEGTSSTPSVFQLPQMGLFSYRCDRSFRVQPFFDTRGASAEEQVTAHAQNFTRRNFRTRIVGHSHGKPLRETSYLPEPVVALPFAHYSTVTFILSTGTEARALTANLTAEFVAGIFKRKGYPPLGACYVKYWLVSMRVSPY
jgi:hypothetical protein